MTSLFDSITIRGVTLGNRLWVSPMCQYSATNGFLSRWHTIHLGSFATGGAGLVLVEATAVTPEGRISVGCTGIWSDELAEEFRDITGFAHEMNSKIGIQLAHAGRKGSTLLPWDDHEVAAESEGGWETVAPSEIPFDSFPVPHALTIDEIQSLIIAFGDAAERAVFVGFDVIEIHAAHGYLIHEFLSPLSNARRDDYGGDLNSRSKFLVEVVQEVRSRIPLAMPLFVRVSAMDWVDGGWNLEESIQLAALLKELGVDLIDVSTGGLMPDARITVEPGYQVKFATAIKEQTGILCSTVGLIYDSEFANNIIQAGSADAVLAARQFLRNPRWAFQAAEELGQKIPIPIQLERARRVR